MDAVLFREKFIPWIVALVAAVGASFLPFSVRQQIEKDLSNSVVTVVSILFAFAATSLTLLLTAASSPGFARLEKYKDEYRSYVNYHIDSILITAAACLLSLVAIMMNSHPQTWWHVAFFGFWIFSVVASVATFYRLVHLLRHLVLGAL